MGTESGRPVAASYSLTYAPSESKSESLPFSHGPIQPTWASLQGACFPFSYLAVPFTFIFVVVSSDELGDEKFIKALPCCAEKTASPSSPCPIAHNRTMCLTPPLRFHHGDLAIQLQGGEEEEEEEAAAS